MTCMGLTNYARWLPVHLRDMLALPEKHPAVYAEFIRGHFVVQKTKRKFSAIGMDQTHEQQNELVEGVGGAIGLTKNPQALQRWMVSGPEIARLVLEYETTTEHSDETNSSPHHEQQLGTQTQFMLHVRSLTEGMRELGNPFKEDSGSLINIVTKPILGNDVDMIMRRLEGIGKRDVC